MRCLLRKGGLFYLGVPNGVDILRWNADRTYGPIRWPILLAGFKIEALYYPDGAAGVKKEKRFAIAPGHTGSMTQITLVLRKVDD